MQDDPDARLAFRVLALGHLAMGAVTAVPALAVATAWDTALVTLVLALGWTLTWALPPVLAAWTGDLVRSRWAGLGLSIGLLTGLTALSGSLISVPGLLFVSVPLLAAVQGHRLMTWASVVLTGLAVTMLLLVLSPGANALDLAACLMILAAGGAGSLLLARLRDPVRVPLSLMPRASDEARLLVENAGDILARHDADGHMLSISPALTELLGYAPQALKGRTPVTLLHPEDWHIWEDLLERLSNGTQNCVAELRLQHGAGHYVWIELNARAAASGFVSVTRVIEERKRGEQSLVEAREAAEAANQSKSRFLAGVSHELRTPLNAIIGFSEVMSTQMFGPLGSRRYEEYADYIHESGRHLLDLINDILDMSKIEAGRYELHLASVRMPLVLERCLKTIAYGARKGGVRLAVDLPLDTPNIWADERAMRQIMLNLLSNAVKFTPRGGTIAIALRTSEGMMTLDVSDTGIGIPRDALDRIGKPFEQVHRPVGFDGADCDGGQLAAGVPGTGLGLAIVKALVSLHDGVMSIQSEEGVGTTVSVSLPVRRAPAQIPGRPRVAA